MSTMTVTTRITYKYLMNKTKTELCDMILYLKKYPQSEFRKLMQLKKYELSDMILKLLDNSE